MKKAINHHHAHPELYLNLAINHLGTALGATEIGFSDLTRLPAPKRMGFSRAITVIIRLSDGILNQIQDPTHPNLFQPLSQR